MVSQGLRPEHRLLDVGCGALRGGVHFISYLTDGHYHGVDAQRWLLEAGRQIELPDHGLARRTVHLACRDDFAFSAVGTAFDYAIAQSVFTHLPWNRILRCLHNIREVMAPGGKFFATFFEDADGCHQAASLTHGPVGIVTFPDADPFHYEFDVFIDLARRTGLTVRYVGDWGHPRGQRMMCFAPREGA